MDPFKDIISRCFTVAEASRFEKWLSDNDIFTAGPTDRADWFADYGPDVKNPLREEDHD